MRVILIAPPGAGKGTQGQRIARRYNVPHFSSGEVFRREVARDSSIGWQVRGYLQRGDLVPDDLVIDLVLPPITETALAGGGYVLDGFPRTVPQAKAAAAVAERVGLTAMAVIHLDAPRDVLIERMLSRGEQRADDNEQTIRHRLSVYDEQTRPLLDYYHSRELVVTIDTTPPIDEVSQSIYTRLDPMVVRTSQSD